MKKIISLVLFAFSALLSFAQSSADKEKKIAVVFANGTQKVYDVNTKAVISESKVALPIAPAAKVNQQTAVVKPVVPNQFKLKQPTANWSANKNTSLLIKPVNNANAKPKGNVENSLTGIIKPQPVQVATTTTKPVTVATNAINSKSAINTLTTVAPANADATDNKVINTDNKLPVATLNNTTQVKQVEIPNSVVNPAAKVPVVPMQTAKPKSKD